MHRYRSVNWLSAVRDPRHRLAAQVAAGVIACLVMIGARVLLDQVAPQAGPFALLYPTIMAASLFGGVAGGLTGYALGLLFLWYFELPPVGSFDLAHDADFARLAINAASALLVLAISSLFLRAVTHKQGVLLAEIDRRATLLRELNHRTRNNFALVLSLLELQRRDAADAGSAAALDKAIRRVHGFAGAYALLLDDDETDEKVDVGAYLETLSTQIVAALVPPGVTINRAFDAHMMARERAVAIGLTLNECVTNAAKYAFPAGTGMLDIRFALDRGQWCLTVEDDGGAPGGPSDSAKAKRGGVGSGLMAAFAQQAQGRLERSATATGIRVALCGAA